MKARLLGVATLLCIGIADFSLAPTAKASTIDYAPNGQVGEEYWGPGTGQSYGMIFTAPQSVLGDYSLSTSGSPSFPFVSQVYQFDGSTIVGSALFTSTIQFTTPGVFTTYTFAPNISLIAGDQYMAIMTNDPNGVSLGGNDPIFGGLGYAEGTNATGSAFDYAVGDPSIPSNWLCKGPCLGALVAFHADFSDATPLPATLPLFATGLGALGLLGWSRKRKNTTRQGKRT